MKKAIRIVALLLVVLTVLGAVPAPASAAAVIDENSGWTWPTKCAIGKNITSGFAVKRSSDIHQGIDIGVITGTEVYAARSGEVYDFGSNPYYGNYVCIRHGQNANGQYLFSTYMHLSKILVKDKGQKVNACDVIGTVGSTGDSTGPHLHFHVFRHSSYDPGAVTFPRTEKTVRNIYVDVQRSSMYASTLNVSVTSHPTEHWLGKGHGMRGTVTSNYKITEVRAAVYNCATGAKVMSTIDRPGTTSMNLQFSNVNNGLIFNDLPIGKYRLEIIATDSSGKTVNWNNGGIYFEVKVPVVTITGSRFPTRLNKGKAFGLRGVISTNFNISEVRGEIIRKSDGASVDKTWDYPGSQSLDIRYANLNNYLEFNLLKPGKYTLKLTIRLSCGYTFVKTQDFEVLWW